MSIEHSHHPHHTACTIVPPYLLARIAQLDDPRLEQAAVAARRSLDSSPSFREVRAAEPAPTFGGPSRTAQAAERDAAAGDSRALDRLISDSENTETLPGRIARAEGDEPVDDAAVNDAYDGLGATHAFFLGAFGRASIDGRGMRLDASVHYGREYDNAFWDGTRMVFGDGDGEIFAGFTRSLSVIGHELGHGVTQHTANLIYQGQSGALNESMSDVFGALVEQHRGHQRAEEASWLIGEGIFTDRVEGRALRSMIAPGTAYDDDVLGRDPQPAEMSGYIETDDDNGGVHLNSGIPNRAFALVATRLGGFAWERPGRIWYETLIGDLPAAADFADFAAATIVTAVRLFGHPSSETTAVTNAWTAVGVVPTRRTLSS